MNNPFFRILATSLKVVCSIKMFIMVSGINIEPLFIKPLNYPGTVLFQKFYKGIGKTISFRSLDLETDLEMIYQWVNMPYSLAYWQLDGDKKRVWDTYYNIQRNSNGHSFIGLLDSDPICQFDVYRVLADEINQYLTAGANDCGFHLLMAPNKSPVPNLSFTVVRAFLDYYFSFAEAFIMYAEPDVSNARSNGLLQKLGFVYRQSILMSYKTANLYSFTRNDYQKKCYV